MSEALIRKKRVRAAHRGSVTRIVDQVYEVLQADDSFNIPRLKQQRMTLSGKLDVLSKLDDELIESIDEEELDEEVEQADKVREKIILAMIDIDHALERAKTRAVIDDSVTWRSPSVEMNLVSRDENPERLDSPTEATLTTVSHTNVTTDNYVPIAVTMPTTLFTDPTPSSAVPIVAPITGPTMTAPTSRPVLCPLTLLYHHCLLPR